MVIAQLERLAAACLIFCGLNTPVGYGARGSDGRVGRRRR